jgi:hypothetical protein
MLISDFVLDSDVPHAHCIEHHGDALVVPACVKFLVRRCSGQLEVASRVMNQLVTPMTSASAVTL